MLGGVDGNHGIDKGGFSNGIYSRVMLKADSKTESGIEIVGTYTFTRDCRSDTDNCGVSANENALAFGGSFGTIAFGETGTVGTSLHSRLTAGIPTAEPDGLLYTHFITVDPNNTYTGANETKYASNPMTIKYFSNSYSGFSFGISHTTNSSIGGGDSDSNNQQTVDYTAGSFNDLTEIVAKYETLVDSMNIAFTYGYGMANAGSQGASEYEDLNESTYSLALSYGGVSADYSWLEGSIPVEDFQRLQNIDDNSRAQSAHAIQARNLSRLSQEGMIIGMGTDGNTPWGAHIEMEDMVLKEKVQRVKK